MCFHFLLWQTLEQLAREPEGEQPGKGTGKKAAAGLSAVKPKVRAVPETVSATRQG